MNRREAVQRGLVAAGGMLVAGQLPHVAAGQSVGGAPEQRASPRPDQEVVLSVKQFGAAGDGKNDDTSALQAAVNALPIGGGVVKIPAGTYMIDPARAILLISNLTLELAEDAVLQALPTATRVSSVLRVLTLDNVIIRGGVIRGGEFRGESDNVRGVGVEVRACSNVLLSGVTVEGFSLDSVLVGVGNRGRRLESEGISLEKCTLRGSSRQGISVTGCLGFRMVDCDLSDIGQRAPGSAIDLEPNPGDRVGRAEVIGCRMRDCYGFGVQIGHKGVHDVLVADNEITRCRRGGIQVRGATAVVVRGNRIAESRPAIIVRSVTADVEIMGNRCGGGGIVVEPRSLARIGDNDCQ